MLNQVKSKSNNMVKYFLTGDMYKFINNNLDKDVDVYLETPNVPLSLFMYCEDLSESDFLEFINSYRKQNSLNELKALPTFMEDDFDFDEGGFEVLLDDDNKLLKFMDIISENWCMIYKIV